MNRKDYFGKKYRPYLSKKKKNKGNILALRKENLPKKDISNLDTSPSEILPSVSTVDNTVSHDNNIISTNTIIPEHGESSLEYSYSSNNSNSFSIPEKCVVSGRRIVNIQHIFNTIAKIKHHPFYCTEFHFICEICYKKEVVRTEPFTDELAPINLAIVASTVHNGQGYSNIEQFSASLNMPCMSNPTYQKLHEEVGEKMKCIAWDATEEAAKEEAKITLENGDVSKDGIPMISVVVDGAWSKRSYRSNYNALSGVACIVGYKTKKVLFIGVRNKYYTVCKKAETMNRPPTKHECFKNWSGTSTAMEADIIVDGFRQSVKMHNLIYNQIIGDGDSSVIKKIQIAKPFGNEIIVKKIECTNHILRNYSVRLRNLSTKRKSASGLIVPGFIRTKIKENLLRLRFAVTKAITFRKNMDLPQNEKVKLLKIDILNGPFHVFGFHDKCDSYFCSKNKENEVNLVPELQKYGVWNDLIAAVNLVAYHSNSLIYHVNNNSVETYNSVVAKYVGGKRVNFSLRGSYNARCNTAVSAYNYGPNYLRQFYKKSTNFSPGIYTKKFIAKENKRRYTEKTNCKISSRPKIKKKIIFGPDSDYGAVDKELGCQPLSMTKENFEDKKIEFLDKLKLNKTDISKLERRTIDQSNNEEWKKERLSRLTASNFGKICKMRKTTIRKNTIISILYQSYYFHGTTATSYGIQFESIAKTEFETMYNLKVLPAGLFVDFNLPFLAASPDGLIGNDAIIEIKCPYSAKDLSPVDAQKQNKLKFMEIESENLILKKNYNYYFQVQGQLHITQRNVCYIVVWTPKGISVDTIYRDDEFWNTKMETSLAEFYLDHLLPEIIDPKFSPDK
ncbi:hypothetical protein QTP88_029181 [Uroleucon formosanum]